MAAKKTTKKQLRDAEPTILRNYDPMAMEKRVFDMDHASRRSWDLFSLEERIHQLEIGGGSGPTVTVETGTFTSSSTADGTVAVNLTEITGKPDLIIVKMVILGEYINYFFYIDAMHTDNAHAGNYWHNVTSEAVYVEDMAGTVAGIKSVTNGKFTFQSGNGDIAGIEATFTAYKWSE